MSERVKLLSILLPVRNEAESLKMMVPILEATVEFPHEVLVIYDFPEDNSVEVIKRLEQKYSNIRLVLNDFGRGLPNAIKKGVNAASGDVILITMADEVFPIAAIGSMLRLIEKGCDFVSCTRYAYGGKRLGGSLSGRILSRLANKMFQIVTGSILTDATAGMKMLKKSVFDRITLEAKPVGWAFAFELSIKAQLLGLRIAEIPFLTVDRPFGGQSTFRVLPWTIEYLRWFMWGLKRLNRFNRIQKKAITIEALEDR